MIKIYNGDCLEIMSKIQDKSIDAIITDPPYGVISRACKWDSVIPFNKHLVLNNKIVYEDEFILHQVKHGTSYNEAKIIFSTKAKNGIWEELKRIIKPNGAIVLFGSEPFSSALRMSNIKNYKYDWVWDKNVPAGMGYAKYRPMQQTECISVFTKNGEKTKYNKQMIKRDKVIHAGGNNISNKVYNGFIGIGKKDYNKSYAFKNPITLLKFNKIRQGSLHPTQKPVALMEYLIKTYTNEGETVLDFTMGSGTTGVACKKLNRSFVGIEQDKKYCEIAIERLKVEVMR